MLGPKALLLAGAGSLLLSVDALDINKKPNIIVILTDDQDVSTLAKREYLPRIHEHLVDEGVLYDNFFAPVSVCCPSRVSLLRAQYAHNHNVTFVSAPWGGWDVFNKLGYVGHTLPDFVQAAGYNTYYTGKLMNDHTDANCESLPVSGFNSSDILVDPYTYDYWTPGFSRDNGPVEVHAGEYSTDLVHEKAVNYLEDALQEDRPFYLTVAPVACHSWLDHKHQVDLHKFVADIPASHPRHARLFPVEQIERTENWNPDEPSGVSWVKELPKLNSTQEAYLDEFFRGRLRALQAVDEIVEDIVDRLEKAGELDNTYIFYTADNGYALGSHRRQPGKTLGFEEDIHVPLIARGPGIKKGFRDSLSSYGMVDLSRTILDIAGAYPDYTDDGRRINLHQRGQENLEHQIARHAISEYWVMGVDEGVFGGQPRMNNTYRTLRIHDKHHGKSHSLSYSVWCTGERELYDLDKDPKQINNLLAPLNQLGAFAPFNSTISNSEPVLSHHLQNLLNRLDALLLVLKRCTGEACHNPYRELFPSSQATGGEIFKFSQILESRFNAFFKDLPKVQFDKCALGFQEELEKPDWKKEWAYGSDARDNFIGGGIVFQDF
ncbi:hypothetical protein LQV05_003143 [Cryptococcus neoformans]|nr:arylsulfatase [Cryptococcus neoformans var. grubii]OXC58873.1 arylsulfatase [Cryptococcus neoformans var. grubii MW-RSA852]UOH80489.1 hypothetical protein LQV05_003143 [Cryptococcus neoformans]